MNEQQNYCVMLVIYSQIKLAAVIFVDMRFSKIFVCVSGPDYIRQKYNEPLEVKEVCAEEKKDNSPSGSPHFYRKGTTPTQSPSQSPAPSPASSPAAVKKTFFGSKTPAAFAAAEKESKTLKAEGLTAGKQAGVFLNPTDMSF